MDRLSAARANVAGSPRSFPRKRESRAKRPLLLVTPGPRVRRDERWDRASNACKMRCMLLPIAASPYTRLFIAGPVMKPPPFQYHDPKTVAEAVGLLGRLENAKLLAGGQSLMPMLNMR